MDVTETVFSYDKRREASAVYRTTWTGRTRASRVSTGQGDVPQAGPITLLVPPVDEPFAEFRRDPIETRRLFAERGWKRVVGFQTATRCTAPTSTSRRRRSRSATACC